MGIEILRVVKNRNVANNLVLPNKESVAIIFGMEGYCSFWNFHKEYMLVMLPRPKIHLL